VFQCGPCMFRADRYMLFRRLIEILLIRLVGLVFPAVLVAVAVFVLIWQLVRSDSPEGVVIPIKVWEQTTIDSAPTHADVLMQLDARPPIAFFDTHLSVNDYWFAFDAISPTPGNPLVIDFPSRHASSLTCWDSRSDLLLGNANRWTTDGNMSRSRAGFALTLPYKQGATPFLCKAAFRGPAKISAKVWTNEALYVAQALHQKTAATIEAGIGVLAVFMLLTAIVNRSGLYWTFAGWLLLNMRMAAVSAGTDFDFFGAALNPPTVIVARQWTVCMYFAMTAALFSLLFKKELAEIRAGIPLALAQIAAVLFIAACPFVSFEQTLVALWFGTGLGVLVLFYYLYRIVRKTRSRMALWYSASIVVTLVASMNEVVAAATGQRDLLFGLNSVTAAIASALLASAAVAEHMRSDRLERIEAQRTLKAAYEDSPIGLFTLNDGDHIVKANPVFWAMVAGIGPVQPTHLSEIFDASLCRDIATMQVARSRASIEVQAKGYGNDSGTDHWFSIRASTIDGAIVEGSLQDITDKVRATERLEFLANHDPLTECLNLRGIARKFDRLAQQPTALAYFDLDRFKLINDLYGHTAGDNVLKQVCERIKRPLWPEDLLARVGGDEFVIAFPQATVSQAAERCRAIVDLISAEPYQIDSQSFALSVSGGLVGTERFFAESPLNEIVSAADTLCRMAKKRAAERLIVMESDDKFFHYHKEELDLIASLERGETPNGLFLVMQPEISLSDPFGSLNFEILLRLRKPDGQVIPAGIIIDAAEAHGKTAIIDRWVVTTAIEWLESHVDSLRNTQFVGINLSGGSLNDETFTEELFRLFEHHPVALSMICIEITETVALTDMRNMQRFIDRVRSMGAKVGLDDFGAGYSSFGYLKGLSVDALKLDGSLVKDAANSPAGMAIILAIASLVNNLGMKSIGEFAENLETIKALASAGVDYAQGYGISKPVLPERILAAHSSADFIEVPEILAFVRQLQLRTDDGMPLFNVRQENILH
jgi:diguanylate cyclase (GGDEF)-like protein